MNRVFGPMAALLILLAAVAPRPALAANAAFRKELKRVAEGVLVTLKEERHENLAIADFVARNIPDANSGPGITELFKSVLEELKPGVVKRRADVSLTGSFSLADDPLAKGLSLLKVSADLTDSSGRTLQSFSAEVRDTGAIAEFTNSSVELPPKATREQRNEKLATDVKKPTTRLDGTQVRAAAGRPYAIEILVAPASKAPKTIDEWDRISARAPRDDEGVPFIEIRRDEVYAVRVHNEMPHDAAVTLAVDGIDAFHFSEVRDPKSKQPKFTSFIVKPKTAAIIPGWHKNLTTFDSFLVTEYGKGASAKEPNLARGRLGVVTVTFALAWEGDVIPDEEKGARDGGNETGFGPPVKADQKEVQRHIGVVRDVISVRYTR